MSKITRKQTRDLSRLVRSFERSVYTDMRGYVLESLLEDLCICETHYGPTEPTSRKDWFAFRQRVPHFVQYTSLVSNITYQGRDAVMVALGLSGGEAAALLDGLPVPRDVWLVRARRILRSRGWGKYSSFFRSTCKRLLKRMT